MKKIEYNGEWFEVVTGNKTSERMIDICEYTWVCYRSVFDVYQRPSIAKQNIDRMWQRFADDIGAIRYHIPSFNSHMFTIAFEAYKLDGIENGWFYITPTHNYFIPKNH